MKRLATLALIPLLTACAGGPTSTPTPTPTEAPKPRLAQAAWACPRGSNAIRDGGLSLAFDTPGKDDRGKGDEMTMVACVLAELKAPSHVVSHISSTRALDGQQTDEWDGIKARWTFHPDAGLNLTLVDTQMQ